MFTTTGTVSKQATKLSVFRSKHPKTVRPHFGLFLTFVFVLQATWNLHALPVLDTTNGIQTAVRIDFEHYHATNAILGKHFLVFNLSSFEVASQRVMKSFLHVPDIAFEIHVRKMLFSYDLCSRKAHRYVSFPRVCS